MTLNGQLNGTLPIGAGAGAGAVYALEAGGRFLNVHSIELEGEHAKV